MHMAKKQKSVAEHQPEVDPYLEGIMNRADGAPYLPPPRTQQRFEELQRLHDEKRASTKATKAPPEANSLDIRFEELELLEPFTSKGQGFVKVGNTTAINAYVRGGTRATVPSLQLAYKTLRVKIRFRKSAVVQQTQHWAELRALDKSKPKRGGGS